MILIPADTETRSECELKTHGAHRYFEHPSTRIQLFSYAVGDISCQLWSKEDGEPIPKDLIELFRDPEYVFLFHNSWFDRCAIEHDRDLIRAIGFVPPIDKYRCTMAMAFSHGLPGSLDKLGEALAIPVDTRKHRDGKRLVQLFCKPRKQRDGSLKWATPTTHPEDWERYKDYCRQDTIALREVIKRIPKWNYTGEDLEYWFLDQEINSRGMQIDLDLVDSALTVINKEQASLAKKTQSATDGDVHSASQRDALLNFINVQYGMSLENLQKATVEKLIEDPELPPELQDLLQVRLDTCTTSTAKYKRIRNVVSADGRARGVIQFAGAGRTARDAGRLTQPQNYARPTMKHPHIVEGIEAIKGGYASEVGFDIMQLTKSALRYTIVAKPEHKLVVADLANIEGRTLAWLAGEDWKLQAFRDFDAGVGPDLYLAAYGKAFGIDPATLRKSGPERQVGKVLELSMGYQGAVGAFISFAVIYGLNLAELAEILATTVPKETLAEAESFYDWLDGMDIAAAKKEASLQSDESDWHSFYVQKSTLNLPRHVFAPIDAIKRLWRKSHPATVKLWSDAEMSVRAAINTSGVKWEFGNGMYAIRSGKWTRIVLPSGHSIPYPAMEIDHKGSLRYKGVDGFTKKWGWLYTFGGKLIENCTQAFSRDVFKYGQLRADRAGYKVILPVHDELVTEVPDEATYSVHVLESIMAVTPPWAEGLPLAAEGFEDKIYHK